jgi:hypothetical protein
MQEDYIIRQLKDISKVLAIIIGFYDNGKIEEALKMSEHLLETDFGLSINFTKDEILAKFKLGDLSMNDLKQLLNLIITRSNLLEEQSIAKAIIELDKGLEIIALIQDNSNVFDLNLSQKKVAINAKINQIK